MKSFLRILMVGVPIGLAFEILPLGWALGMVFLLLLYFAWDLSHHMAYVFLFLLAVTAEGATTYYCDSDWTGTQSGTQAQPFKSLTAGAWTTINTALGSGDVTVYFSARKQGSDTDQIYSATGSTTTPDEVDMTLRTDTSNNYLIFNGHAFWNQSDTTPSWAAYVGNSHCRFKSLHSDCGGAGHNVYSFLKFQGLHVVAPHTLKAFNLAGNNIWVDGCIVEQTDAVSSANNPLIQLIPTADGAHQGSTCFAGTPCSNIFFVNNELSKSSAECFYIGGGGDNGSGGQPTCSTQGYPTHHDIWITNNFIHDSAFWPGSDQGDGIDVKGGITNLWIGYNIISNLPDSNAAGIRGIVTQGQVCPSPWNVNIFANRIYKVNAEDGVINFSDSWGTPGGVALYDNIIANNTGGVGIHFYHGQGGNVAFNNTIVSNASSAISVDASQTLTITNNLLLNNIGNQLVINGTGTHGNNGYAGTLGVSAAATDFVTTSAANFNNAANLDYSLLSTAPAIGAGVTVTFANYDIVGTPRPQGTKWDVGAYEFRNFIPVITNVTLIMR